MKYTTIEVINVLYQTIANSALVIDPKKPNGKLCKLERLDNSVLEDTVINAVGGINKEDVQEGVLNVNQYVPNLIYPNNPSLKSQPDNARILYLSKLLNAVLGDGEEVWSADGTWCFVLQQDMVYPDTNNQHYINFRVEFYLNN